MADRGIEIADALATAIDALDLGQAKTVARLYVPVIERSSLDRLTISVVPRSVDWSRSSRDRDTATISVDIGIMRPVSGVDDAQLDVAGAVVEQLRAAVRGVAMAGSAYLRMSRDPYYDPEHLRAHHVYTTVLTVSYFVGDAA